MLSKLLKFEMKATARVFLPLIAVMLAYTGVFKAIYAISSGKWGAPLIISFVIYWMILTGLMVMTYVVTIQRFYKNLLSDEGYLMFTLPAKPWKHITSKLLLSMMWTLGSAIAAIISIFIIAVDSSFINNIHEVLTQIKDFFGEFDDSVALFILEMLALGTIGLASNALIIYASIAVGHLVSKHRVLTSLGAYIAMNAITQILFAVTVIILGNILPMNHLSAVYDFHSMDPTIHYMMLYAIVFMGLLSGGYFILVNYILARHLNLE